MSSYDGFTESKHQNLICHWAVEECRGCGRSFTFPAPKSAGTGDTQAIGRCGECGETTRTGEQVNPSEWEGSR